VDLELLLDGLGEIRSVVDVQIVAAAMGVAFE
jgi:hypothetical protein